MGRASRDMRNFNIFIKENNFMEVPLSNGRFTWSSEGEVISKSLIDRFLVSNKWEEAFEKRKAFSTSSLSAVMLKLLRFGSGSVPTHLVGASLLRGEWKGAVNMILDPREGDILLLMRVQGRIVTLLICLLSNARDYYKESDDIDGTLKQLPRYLVAERAILQCLKKCPGNYLQALKAIPRTLRMMYVHSYQSYLWNHAASMRVQKYGIDKVVVGDLVYCKENHTETAAVQNSEEYEDEDCGDANSYDSCHLEEVCKLGLPTERHKLVKAVTAGDVLSGNFTIDDVVLPLPGSRVLYPTNDIAEVYNDLATKPHDVLLSFSSGVYFRLPLPRQKFRLNKLVDNLKKSFFVELKILTT
ncbi:hypothetical protein CSA_016968 [Cucumis sativus]|uniref:Uncharacterized protein n=1 Tax=Cucumis sativus TaxID=3659 RepID=A0ACB6HC44_CUCSA|nr:hypothetical protein CSA_016968 [Cucumis sativus]